MSFWEVFQETYVTPNFYRLITATFAGAFGGFFLSLQLQRLMERRIARKNLIMHLYSIKIELELNQRSLDKLTQLTSGVEERPSKFFDMDSLKSFYSTVFALIKSFKTASYEAMLRDGMLVMLPTEERSTSIVKAYSEIESIIFESESSYAWLEQVREETPSDWLNRKKETVSYLHNRIKKALEQVTESFTLVEAELESLKK